MLYKKTFIKVFLSLFLINIQLKAPLLDLFRSPTGNAEAREQDALKEKDADKKRQLLEKAGDLHTDAALAASKGGVRQDFIDSRTRAATAYTKAANALPAGHPDKEKLHKQAAESYQSAYTARKDDLSRLGGDTLEIEQNPYLKALAGKHADSLKAMNKSAGDTLAVQGNHLEAGKSYSQAGMHTQAGESYRKAAEAAEQSERKKALTALALQSEGEAAQGQSGGYEKSKDLYAAAAGLHTELGDHAAAAHAYSKAGMDEEAGDSHTKAGNHLKAVESYTLALDSNNYDKQQTEATAGEVEDPQTAKKLQHLEKTKQLNGKLLQSQTAHEKAQKSAAPAGHLPGTGRGLRAGR